MSAESEKPFILVVEDDEATGEVISLTIEQETPYRSHVVTNGHDALSFLGQCVVCPALLILDYRLPDINGTELMDQLQLIPALKPIPVLLMSATTRKEEIEARSAVLMEKPFELDAFIATIERLVTHSPSVEPLPS